MLNTHDAQAGHLLLCLRIPKSGSLSLERALARTLSSRRRFYVPNTLEFDGRLSRLQHLRFRRNQARNLMAHYQTRSLGHALRHIDRESRPGDLLSGGHADFRTLSHHLSTPLKIVTMMRDPFDRCRSEYHYSRCKFLGKSPLARMDCSVLPRIAAKTDFDSYIDFLFDHRDIYGNIATAYLGLQPWDEIGRYFQRHVFHAGVLEQEGVFSRMLGEKLGAIVQMPRLNVSGSAEHVAIGTRARRKIELLYDRDFEIYEFVRDLAHGTPRPAPLKEWPAADDLPAGHAG
ncbi:MAG TPA: sulfotransferase domain-containing protein [Micropepsaceae bacterium]|nr:sulfotransferase domain-containing protein [Micropepsaceae bacterium]